MAGTDFLKKLFCSSTIESKSNGLSWPWMDGVFRDREERIVQMLQQYANENAMDFEHCDYPSDILRNICFLSMQSTKIEHGEKYLFEIRFDGNSDCEFVDFCFFEHQSVEIFNWCVKNESIICLNDKATHLINGQKWTKRWTKEDVAYVFVDAKNEKSVLMNVWIKSNGAYSKKIGIECNVISLPFNVQIKGCADFIAICL